MRYDQGIIACDLKVLPIWSMKAKMDLGSLPHIVEG